jgi:hypothetical protein
MAGRSLAAVQAGMLRVSLLACLAACSHPTDPAPPSERAAAWRDDLHVLATEIPAKHKNAFFHVPEADWRKQVADLDAKLPQLDDAHVITGFARLVAAIGDAHTLIGAGGHSGWYPLAFAWFDDGIFVVGATDSWAIGRKLVGISGHPIDDVIAAVTPLVSHDNLSGLHGGMNDVLLDPALLAGSDLAPADHASFSLAAADGTVRELDVKPGKSGAHVAPPNPLPLHLQGPAANYWNKYDEPNRLLFFEYNACAEDPRVGPIAKLIEGTLGFVDQHPVDRFVIDLRSNEGGDSRLIEPLLVGLAARPALAGKIYAIIGMHTFSSGMMAAMDLKRRVHATLVGGPSASRPTGYGEIVLMTLPHSKLKVQYSTKLFENPDFPADAVEPDLPVKVTSTDWFAGRDPAIDAILKPR